MKKQQFVDQILATVKTYEWGLEKLNSRCDRAILGGGCNGKSCGTCPIEDGKKKLAKKFGVTLPEDPTPITVNITVEPKGKAVFKFKNTEFRWV